MGVQRGQVIDAFVAALLGEGVSSEQIQRAVLTVQDVRLGQDLAQLSRRPAGDLAMVRTLMFDATRRLERG